MSAKRANNEGTIFKRKDGRWVAEVTGVDGARWTQYAKTQSEARLKKRAMLEEIAAERLTAGATAPLRAYLAHWLTVVENGLRPKTITQFQRIVA